MLEDTVEDYALCEDMTVENLVSQMDKAWGFTAGKVASSVRILQNMMEDHECFRFLAITGNLFATGVRGAINELVKRKLVNSIITTCGGLDHDIARSWKKYYKGSFVMDDAELRKNNISRLGNVLVPDKNYGVIIEEKTQTLLQNLWREGVKEVSTRELCFEIGKRACNESSLLYWAAKNNISIYVPGIMDGAVGYQIWLFSQDRNFKIDLLKDAKELNDAIFTAKKTGALIVGGGISKHHTLWWNQFRGGLDYAVYITTAVEWDGSLSGARPREAVSWGKINKNASRSIVEGDASLILPIMISALLTRMGGANRAVEETSTDRSR